MRKITIYIIGLLLSFNVFSTKAISDAPVTQHESPYTAPVEIKRVPIKRTVKTLTIENTADKCEINASLNAIPKQYQDEFIDIVEKLGCEKFKSLRTIEIFDDMSMPRAMAGSTILKIRTDSFEKTEFESLMIHEFGHIIDLGYFKGDSSSGVSMFRDGSTPIFNNDISTDFYKISWNTAKNRRIDSDPLDFVSGYAKTDAFEDFAETMLYYIEHNKEFRILASKNNVLKKKYEFMRDNVFEGKVVNSGNNYVDHTVRQWDATKLAINN